MREVFLKVASFVFFFIFLPVALFSFLTNVLSSKGVMADTNDFVAHADTPIVWVDPGGCGGACCEGAQGSCW